MSIKTLLKAYAQHLEVSVKPSTKILYLNRLRLVLSAMDVNEMTKITPQSFARYRMNTNRGPATLNTDLQILKCFLNWAVDFDYCEANQLQRMRSLPQRAGGARRVLAEEEISRLANHGDRGIFWDFMIATGLRKNEFAGLIRTDIDLSGHQVTVREEITKSSKTRVIPIPESLSDRLALHFNGDDPDAPAFKNNRGRRWGKNGSLLRALIKDAQACDIPTDNLNLHALRKTCGTRLIEAGVDVKTVQYILGHADARITLDLYTEYRQRDDPKLLKAMKILPPPTPSPL